MSDGNRRHLRRAIELAQQAREHGNHPFGALLVDGEGNVVLEAENTVRTDKDVTAHAETNLMRLASARFEPDYLERCTLYTSTEPCAMCAGAIYWGNIRRVVFATSQEQIHAVSAGTRRTCSSSFRHARSSRAAITLSKSAGRICPGSRSPCTKVSGTSRGSVAAGRRVPGRRAPGRRSS